MSPDEGAKAVQIAVRHEVMGIETKVKMRMPGAANLLRNAEVKVLSGPSPSKPGKTPGVRNGGLRREWAEFYSTEVFGIESGKDYSGYLEHGTRRMKARPYVAKVTERAMPEIRSIFEKIGGQ